VWGEQSKILRCGLVIRDKAFLEVIYRERPISGEGLRYIILYLFEGKLGLIERN
jgi:hypothetical protein